MKNITNILLVVLIACVVGLYFKKSVVENQYNTTTQAIGDTQSTPKMAQIVGNGNGTYSTVDNGYLLGSLCNNTAGDFVINGIDTLFTGLNQSVSTSTASKFPLLAATSSNTTGLAGNTNYVYQNGIATSSANYYEASSTPGLVTANLNRIWPAGTCVNFVAKATTTASVWFKITYLQE